MSFGNPGGSVVKTALSVHMSKSQSLVGELRFHMPCGQNQKPPSALEKLYWAFLCSLFFTNCAVYVFSHNSWNVSFLGLGTQVTIVGSQREAEQFSASFGLLNKHARLLLLAPPSLSHLVLSPLLATHPVFLLSFPLRHLTACKVTSGCWYCS